MSVGERIKERRKEIGLTADELAEKIEKNRATVFRYEKSEIMNIPTSRERKYFKVRKYYL